MSRLAIFIDGGYVDAFTRESNIRIDYAKFVDEIVATVSAEASNAPDLLRTYYYDCLPYQSNPPTDDERRRFSNKRKFFDALSHLPRFQVREGRLAYRGSDREGKPIFQQKRTDLLLGLDFALLSSKRQITQAVLVAGDSDFLPAVEVAKQEGIEVWMFHSPRSSRGSLTYAQELWLAADERVELSSEFTNKIIRQG